MASDRVNLLSPPARIVAGSLYTPNTTDFDGKPLVIKTGPNAGQARVQYFFAIAIPKGPENHWAHTPWGSIIWATGHRAFPTAAQRPDFAWKIDDGDSQTPNKRGRKPCEQEGYPRHWVLKLSSSFAPKVYAIENGGYVEHLEKDFVKPGYWVEVAFNVDGNDNQNNPGVYLNHSMVCFRAPGAEIVFGPNVNEVGFGQVPLPAGVSMVPPASAVPLPAMPPAGAPPAPGAYAPAPAPPAAPQYGPPLPVMPNPGFVQMPAPGAPAPQQYAPAPAPAVYPMPAPAPLPAGAGAALPAAGVPMTPQPVTAYPSNLPPAPAAGPVYRMTAKAGAITREAYLQAGWTDAMLIQQGYMTA